MVANFLTLWVSQVMLMGAIWNDNGGKAGWCECQWSGQSYVIKSAPWTILWFRIFGIFSVENIKRLCVFMFQTCSNSQLLRRVLWISAEQTIGASLKHKNTQPLSMFNRVRVLHLNRLKERTWLHSFATNEVLSQFFAFSGAKIGGLSILTTYEVLPNFLPFLELKLEEFLFLLHIKYCPIFLPFLKPKLEDLKLITTPYFAQVLCLFWSKKWRNFYHLLIMKYWVLV